MSRLVDRRPAAAPSVVLRVLGAVLLDAVACLVLAIGVLLAPRRLLGWVAVAGALVTGVRDGEIASQRELVHPPG